ncbi:glycosyltransferase family 2 protein [Solirubrobacter ginsenosidimutans]|uniref:Glycosyltransferase family 2 protein n=1 Tax=Solirubrobacter ginsenosidimutans TaxID=490573 RepID=A0A9X3S998_9ACTN|nr:glycosyltransferase family 2 protein [Solirubrobacter ginsenosidimutans]MDA0164743.1 glycosyltransferase family 2 protein [Solirubrobacter ginsenosidimutans]
MRLSIVIVAFGGDLSPLLDELAAQRQPGDEVIVVDNAPRGDAMHPVVDRRIDLHHNPGFGAAANEGARVAAGDAVVLLNPDAVPAPGCLDALRHPPAGWDAWMAAVMLADGEHINSGGGIAHFLGFAWAGALGEPASALPAGAAPVGFLSGACLAVRLDVWRELGGMPDHYFLYHEDVDLSHRLRLAGHRFGVLPAARVLHDYEFGKGSYKWRYLERNRWATVLRSYPPALVAVVLPAMLACEPVLLVVALAAGWGRAKLQSWWDVLRWLPALPGERRAVQSTRRVGAREFAGALVAELDSPQFGAYGRNPAVRALLRLYWAGALALVRR